jgi:hypothetical protein
VVVVTISVKASPRANRSARGKHYNDNQRRSNIIRRVMDKGGCKSITACRRPAVQPVSALSIQPDGISSYHDEQNEEVLPCASPGLARCASACGPRGEMY